MCVLFGFFWFFWFFWFLLFLFPLWDGIYPGSPYEDDSGNGGFTVRFGRRSLILARLSTDRYPMNIPLSGVGWETGVG